jgi:hypothetical protein
MITNTDSISSATISARAVSSAMSRAAILIAAPASLSASGQKAHTDVVSPDRRKCHGHWPETPCRDEPYTDPSSAKTSTASE